VLLTLSGIDGLLHTYAVESNHIGLPV